MHDIAASASRTQNAGPAARVRGRAFGRRLSVLGAVTLAAAGVMKPARAATAVRIGGTGSALACMGLLTEAYRQLHPESSFRVFPSLGSVGGLRALEAGVLDIAVAARALNDVEHAKGLRGAEYARTPLVFATHLQTGIADISLADVARIYRGELTTWPDDGPVRLIRRPSNETDWLMLAALSPAMSGAVEIALKRPGLMTAATDQENATAIESLRGSFGLVTVGQILAEHRRIAMLSLDGVDGTVPSRGLGPQAMVRSLTIVLGSEPAPAVVAFKDFVFSAAGAAVLTRYGQLPIGTQS